MKYLPKIVQIYKLSVAGDLNNPGAAIRVADEPMNFVERNVLIVLTDGSDNDSVVCIRTAYVYAYNYVHISFEKSFNAYYRMFFSVLLLP